MNHNSILRVVARFLIPLIMLFALYIQFHGEYSPGGGFQAGVIFAAAWILFALVFGLDEALAVIPAGAQKALASIGVLLYAATGLLGVLLGGRFLDYAPLLPASPQAAQQTGIVLVELGVGITVAAVMMIVYTLFADRARVVADMDREESD